MEVGTSLIDVRWKTRNWRRNDASVNLGKASLPQPTLKSVDTVETHDPV
jgi:hypothetical protein